MIYGAENPFQPLRAVVLAKPGYFDVTHAVCSWQKQWTGNIDLEKAQYQHHQLANVLEQQGVRVYYLPSLPGKVDQTFTRDLGLFTSRGLLLGQLKEQWRQGEDQALIQFCQQQMIPIINQYQPLAFEGGDFIFDESGNGIIGYGPRTNVPLSELESILGVPCFSMEHRSPHHLDAVFNIVDRETVVAHPRYVDVSTSYFENKTVIELDDEDFQQFAANYLVLGNNKILADVGAVGGNAKLLKRGVSIVEVDISELKKGGGSVRCLTLPLLQR